MQKTDPKHEMLERFAAVARALAHASRLDLLELMAQGERDVESLAETAGLTVANASQHLQTLRRSGLVASRKEGRRVFYRLSGDDVLALVGALRKTAERHVAEVDRVVNDYFRKADSLEPVSRRDLLSRLRDGLVVVLDVRPPVEYAAGHIAGAVNLPIKELKKRLGELPPDAEVVAYCRGPYCLLAYEAIAALRRKGRTARRLEDGFPEWRAAGLPVESADR